MIHDTQSAQMSQKQDERNIYVIMKTMCPPGYHHNGFVATHALGHMMYGKAIVIKQLCKISTTIKNRAKDSVYWDCEKYSC